MPTLWQSRETVDKRCPRLGPRLKEVEVIISLAAVCSPDKPLARLSDFGVVHHYIRPPPAPRPYPFPFNKIASGETWLHPGLLGGGECIWIFDSYFKGCVELWSRERGLERISAAYPPSFYMHLKDSHAHWEMIEGLASRYKVEECSFNSIFGTFEGHRIYASRKVAEKIEIRTRYAAELFNVMSGRISGIWQKRTCFHAETGTSQGSLQTSNFL